MPKLHFHLAPEGTEELQPLRVDKPFQVVVLIKEATKKQLQQLMNLGAKITVVASPLQTDVRPLSQDLPKQGPTFFKITPKEEGALTFNITLSFGGKDQATKAPDHPYTVLPALPAEPGEGEVIG